MGRYCRLCNQSRPNESFSGRGHRSHVCKECQRKPRADRKRSGELNELYGFMTQSNISQKNVRRLETLCQASDELVLWHNPSSALRRVGTFGGQSRFP